MKAMVTGASSGIGEAMAKYLSRLGYDLVLVATNAEKLNKVKESLGTNTEIIATDLSIHENCLEVYRQVGKVDVLVNNAGFGVFGGFDKTSLDEEIKLINTNISALHTLTKLYLADMVKENRGYILNMSSLAGFVPGPFMAAYHASKAYILRLTQSISEELRYQNSGVTVSCLCPGPTQTGFNDRAGVDFRIPYFSSDYIAKYAIDRMLKGKTMIIPGFRIKLLIFSARFSPYKAVAKVSAMTQKKRNII